MSLSFRGFGFNIDTNHLLSFISVGTFPVCWPHKAKWKAIFIEVAYSVLCKSSLPCGWLLCLMLLIFGKTFSSCVTYFPKRLVFYICCCCKLIWKGFFSCKSLTALMTHIQRVQNQQHAQLFHNSFPFFPSAASIEGSSVNKALSDCISPNCQAML